MIALGAWAPAAPAMLLLTGLWARTVTLDEALRTAEANQPALRRAGADLRAAEERTAGARLALLPDATASAHYERTTGNRVSRPGWVQSARQNQVDPSWETFNFFDFRLEAEYLLWDFGRLRGRYKAAAARADAFRDSARAAARNVALGVRVAYFGARARKAAAAIARDTLANEERHLAQITGFVDAGQRPRIDVTQARTTRATARLRLTVAENLYAMARAELGQAMGTAGTDTDYDVGDETMAAVLGEDGRLPDLLTEAWRARPDLAAIDRQLEADALAERAARAGTWPALAAVAGLRDSGAIDRLVYNAFGGVTLKWNLGQSVGAGPEARAVAAESGGLRADRDALAQQIAVELQRAVLGVRAAREALGAADEALVAARERLALAEGRYQEGAGSIIELGDAQLDATAAAAQRVQTDYDLATARARLTHVLGR